MAEACKAAGPGSVELFEMDAGSKDSVTALAKAVEGKVLLHDVPLPLQTWVWWNIVTLHYK